MEAREERSGQSASKSTNEPLEHVKSLTGLRFFAAIWVVLLHFGTPQLTSALPIWADSFLRHGQLGVAMFFILSGFVLSYNYLDKLATNRFNQAQFMIARFARVYPAFLLSILIFLPFALKSAISFQDERQGAILFALSFLVHIFLIQTWFPKLLYALKWNTPTWSLGVEAFFYATFPFLAKRIVGMRTSTAITTIVTLLVFLSLTRLAYAAFDLDHIGNAMPNEVENTWAGFLFFNPIMRVPEFAIGILGSLLIQRHRVMLKAASVAAHMAFLASILVGLGAILSFQHDAWTRVWAHPIVLALLCGLILVLSLERIPFVTLLLSSPILVLLGEASYSMYVMQRPVAEYMNFVTQRLGLGYIEGSATLFIIFLAVLTAFSILVYKYFEVPWRRKIRAKFGAKLAAKASPP